MADFREVMNGPAASDGPAAPAHAVPSPAATPLRPHPRVMADPTEEYRLCPRRPVTRRVGASCRRGTSGLGQDIGIDLADASEDGLGVRTRSPLAFGEEVTVELSRPGVSRPMVLVGDVRWCEASADGTFLAGVRLRRRLSYV
jgi:hypothetical protein